jgi:hypothetical protein
MVPAHAVVAMAEAMVDWIEAIRGFEKDLDQETRMALVEAIGKLSVCLSRFGSRAA